MASDQEELKKKTHCTDPIIDLGTGKLFRLDRSRTKLVEISGVDHKKWTAMY